MNRGSSFRRMPAYPVALGFNEAPIHESGKSFSGNLRVLNRLRFNEAPIHESGKCSMPNYGAGTTKQLQ